MKFTLEIELGGAIRTREDVRQALSRTVTLMATHYHPITTIEYLDGSPCAGDGQPVFDAKSNAVGKWAVIEDAPRELHAFVAQDMSDACGVCGKIESYTPSHGKQRTFNNSKFKREWETGKDAE